MLALLLAAGPVHAQQPDRPLPERLRSEQMAPDRLQNLDPAQRPQALKEALQRRQGHPFVSSSITLTDANLFTRAGAGLTGVGGSSSSSVGDVNNDGHLDLLITGGDSNESASTTLYLGDGQGGFTEAGADLADLKNGSTSIADIDEDGNLDLLITGRDDNLNPSATLYLGDGQGGFTEANAGLSGAAFSSTSIADIDEDENLDLLITGEDADGNKTATLYLGDGQGGFTEADAGLTGVFLGSTSIADIDEDENLDLLITGGDADGNKTATLYLGDGQGGFTEADAGLTGVFGSSTSIADVDGDGNKDLLITGNDINGNDSATLYLGDGTGGFTEAGAGLAGVSYGSTSIADMDEDGNLDLLTTGSFTATLYLGDGQGGFTEAGAGLTGVFGSTSVGDVDGDGDTDLVITGYDNLYRAPSARVYVNRTIQEPPNQDPVVTRVPESFTVAPGRTSSPRLIEAGDADGDPLSLSIAQGADSVSFTDMGNGVAELSFTPDRNLAGQSVSFTVEASDGNGGTATKSFTIDVGNEFAALNAKLTGGDESSSFGDVNNDGDLDLVLTGWDTTDTPSATLYLGDGTGGFTKANAGLTGVERSSSALGDVDDDGNLDLVVTGRDTSGSPTATLYLGDGTGDFTKANAGLAGVRGFGSSTFGDVNGDGSLDLVVTGQDSEGNASTTLYLGDGSGGFTEADAGLTDVGYWSSSNFGDVNNDGNLDLVVTGSDSDGNASTTLYLGDGTGGFTKANAGLTGVERSSSALGDVDDDGNLDLVITGDTENGETATVYLGDGTGSFTEANAGLIGFEFGSSTLGDVNRDGNLDLVTTAPGATTLYLGDGTGGFTAANAGLEGTFFGSSLADVNGDTRLDLVISGTTPTSAPATATLYENIVDLAPPQFASTIPSQTLVSGVTLSRGVTASNPAVTLSLDEGGSTPNVNFTDQGDGTGTFTFTPDASQIGQSYSFTISATNVEGETTTTSFTLDVTDKIVPLNADLTGVDSAATAAADVNDDGTQDLLVAGVNDAGTPTTTLYLNDGDGTFTVANAGLPGVVGGAARFADVNADGAPDLVLTGETSDGSPLAALYQNDGTGSFSEMSAGLTDVRRSEVAVGDVGQDGDLDVLIAGENAAGSATTTLYENDGTGSFSVFGADFSGVAGGEVQFADADNNGALDVWVSNQLYLGGFGGFNEALGIENGTAFSATDVDGDGDGDILQADPENTLLYRNDVLEFSSFEVGLHGVDAASARTVDVNGDAAPDVVLTGVNSDDDTTSTLYRNLGTEFGDRLALTGAANGSSTVFDVDGDADKDLLVAGSGSARIYENGFDPVAASVSKTIASDGTEDFGDTGASVAFKDTEGSGTVRVDRISTGARFTLGIPSNATVASYRLTIAADTALSFGPTTELRLDVDDFEGIAEPSTVTIYQRPEEGSGAFEALETTYDEANNELVAEVSRFSEFTLASTDPDNALPVELSSFEARTTGDAATLSWTTASETNNAGFAVQHRADSTGTWQKLGFVESRASGGTASEPQEYRFRTDALQIGTHRFRLRQVDTDGTAHVSRTVTAQVSMDESFRLSTYPNPVQQRATVEVAVKKQQEVRLQLYDVLGRHIATLHDGPMPAQETRTMTLRAGELGLSSGAYFLRLVGENGTKTRRLTVVR